MNAVIRGTALDEKCEVCNGVGIVGTKPWRRWEEENRDKAHTDWTPFPDDPEEEACGECDGTGYVLTDEGRSLLAFLRRHR